jgi:hypothetical protein
MLSLRLVMCVMFNAEICLLYWGMFHLCSKKGYKNSDRMTTFLQDRMVKINLFFRLFNVDFGSMTYILAHTINKKWNYDVIGSYLNYIATDGEGF